MNRSRTIIVGSLLVSIGLIGATIWAPLFIPSADGNNLSFKRAAENASALTLAAGITLGIGITMLIFGKRMPK